MAREHICPLCRNILYLRKFRDDSTHYLWDMSRKDELKEDFLPLSNRRELMRMYRRYPRNTKIRKKSWLQDVLGSDDKIG